MEKRNSWGHIITVSSMSGHRVVALGGANTFYSATKAAATALMEGLRQEVGQCQRSWEAVGQGVYSIGYQWRLP